MKSTNFNPCAGLCLSNWGGIEVEINSYGDGIRYRFNFGEPEKEKVSRWQEIKYSASGRPYFVCHRRRYYLDEFMRY